ncbi:hypothetical protein [Variovorax sp. GT1P44]|uniref:hypothetical protein n=1 Tax=Variovorax sp. GT1P44 TaxID=3443742 RepID=UPI003F481EF4
MKGITTIAAMPSGAGCAAALPAEVGEAKARQPRGLMTITLAGIFDIRPGERFSVNGSVYVALRGEEAGEFATEITCYRDDRFKGN